MNLLIILGCLLIGLIVLVKLTENAKQLNPELLKKMSKWFLPLIALSLILALIRTWM